MPQLVRSGGFSMSMPIKVAPYKSAPSAYVRSDGSGPMFAPYKIATTSFFIYIPLDRKTKKLAYPEYPILIPYTKLSAKTKYKQYVPYLPFIPDINRGHQPCFDIYMPMGKMGFYASFSSAYGEEPSGI